MKKRKAKQKISYKYDPKEWDDSKSVLVEPEKRKSTGTDISTSIRLPKSMISRLRKVAVKKGDIGYQTLLKIWIAERLDEEDA
ncbi:MAG: hypothetical protein AB1540_18030, partial [Bdellovibrionota bacterium]